ncbi:MAG: GntR family transcriptional regulator [Acidobacteriota bacterium]
MRLHVSPGDGVPIYQQIERQVKLLVAAGRLVAGEQLPTVRRLAEQLLVNPNTVARAYRELEAAGVLVARRGAGVFVAEGGSPLAEHEQRRLLGERIDHLLSESRQMGVALDDLLALVRDRDRQLNEGGSD